MIIEGIIAASIAAAGAVISAFIAHRHKSQAQSQSEPKNVIAHDTARLAEAKRAFEEMRSPNPLSLAWRPRLGHADILKAIENVPPFQRDGVHQSFIGHRITLVGTLFGVSHRREGVSITLNLPDTGRLAFCEASRAACSGLELAPKDTEVYVTGTIDAATCDMELKDCTFSFKPPDEG